MSRLDGGALLANKAGSAWTYALRDHQGSTRGLYDGNLTSVGSVEYTPYGESYAASGTSPRFQYTGKEWDATAKLYYFPYRYYSPERARWLTRAPLGMVDGPNVYAYVAGNPVNRVDPDGRCGKSARVVTNEHPAYAFLIMSAMCISALIAILMIFQNLFGLSTPAISIGYCIACLIVFAVFFWTVAQDLQRQRDMYGDAGISFGNYQTASIIAGTCAVTCAAAFIAIEVTFGISAFAVGYGCVATALYGIAMLL